MPSLSHILLSKFCARHMLNDGSVRIERSQPRPASDGIWCMMPTCPTMRLAKMIASAAPDGRQHYEQPCAKPSSAYLLRGQSVTTAWWPL